MRGITSFFFILGLASSGYAYGTDQNTLPAKIPDNLWECYNDSYYYTKDNLLPMTMTSLISLIRKAEDALPNMNIRTLAPALLQRFRFDGIEWNPQAEPADGVIPFSATGPEFDLYRVIFDFLIPSQSYTIPNETFTRIERCTLHRMLSNSINLWARPEGDSVCSSLSTSENMVRVPRSAEKLEDDFGDRTDQGKFSDEERTIFSEEEDVEDQQGESKDGGVEKHGNFQLYGALESDYDKTACPDENGVVYDRFGEVTPGLVLAGIATGLQPQSVSSNTLIQQTPKVRGRKTVMTKRPSVEARPVGGSSVKNTWASTLAGILAEDALIQGPKQDIHIAETGGWNSTDLPKYYFLSEQTRNSLTTARLRGALDGLIMALNIQNWYQKSGNVLKLSQLLSMYYSNKGVFDPNTRACNRKAFYTIADEEAITSQTHAFATVLVNEIKAVTMQDSAILQYSQEAVDLYMDYFGNKNQDITCDDSMARLGVSGAITSPANVDLYIVLDFAADFSTMTQVLIYLTMNLAPNDYTYNVNITVLNARDGTVFLTSVQSFLELFTNFNQTAYSNQKTGFDMRTSLSSLQYIFHNKMAIEQDTKSPAAGPAWVSLFVTTSSPSIPDSDKDSINDKINYFYDRMPDVTFLYLTPGSKDVFTPFARNQTDVYQLTTDQLSTSIDPLVRRLQRSPNRIMNPTCGSSWSDGDTDSVFSIDAYVAPKESQFYRLESNYFYSCDSCQLSISTSGNSMTVCYSTYIQHPISNSSGQGNVTCNPVTDSYKLSLKSFCSNADSVKDCNPLFMSVSPNGQSSNTCGDINCPTVDSVKYTVSHQGLVCYSSVAKLLFSPVILLISIIFHYL